MKMNRLGNRLAWLAMTATMTLATGVSVSAQTTSEPTDLPVVGVPVPGGVNYQPAVTPVAHDMHWLSNMVHWIMLAIVLFVVALLVIIVVRFNSKSNPTPARFTHNTKVEIAWTLLPVVVLIFIGSFSLPILFKQLEVPTPDVTIKATGNQWYWSYYYPEYDMTFDSLMLAREDLESHGYTPDLYLLATDNAVVVPVNKVVHIQTQGADVIHSWAMPAFGVKIDSVPGRLNETWFQAEQEGIYFGQCSELCGRNHSYMPITVKVVSEAAYETWVQSAVAAFGGTMPEAAPAGGAAAAEPAAPAEGAETIAPAESAAPDAETAEPAAPAEGAAPDAVRAPDAPAEGTAPEAAPAAEPAAPAEEAAPAAPAAEPAEEAAPAH